MGKKTNRKPPEYWDDFANIQRELLAFIQEHGTPGVMPTQRALKHAGHGDLVSALGVRGGLRKVAERLGLTYPVKQLNGYWDEFTTVGRELFAFIEEFGMPGIMPSQRELKKARCSSLAWAVNKHGGFAEVAKKLGLAYAYTAKPDGYWDDFINVEQELRAFIEKYGTAGVMPTHKELKDRETSLAAALSKYGGIQVVAERLGLTLAPKPPGRWDNFANVKRELLAFIEQRGIPGIMPTQQELVKASRGDLARAFRAHGGLVAIAARLGLKRTSEAKPAGYWDDFANIEQELLAFIKDYGTPGMMPTMKQLAEAGREDLRLVLSRRGGVREIAKRLGLDLSYTAKPQGYWSNFSHVEQEVLNVIHVHGTPGVMPTYSGLKEIGQGGLAAAIAIHYGGFAAVAERLGLIYTSKPQGHWQDFANVERDLLTFIKTYGTPGVMPTTNELEDAGQSTLAAAIYKHGGCAKIAERLGLAYTYTAKPSGYWNDFANVERELLAFIEEYGIPGIMPLAEALMEANRGDLDSAIRKYGGYTEVAERLALELTFTRKPNGYWNDFVNVERELLAFIEEHGTSGLMPTQEQLVAAGRTDLTNILRKHGGVHSVAERLGLELTYTKRVQGYWNDFANLEYNLLAFIEEHGVPNVMPTHSELQFAKRADLINAIRKHGGSSSVAQRLKLHYATPEHIAARTASEVERIVRALQPLAEAHLLSKPQIMLILRRAGMPSIRNARIASFSDILPRGNHEEIEEALAELRANLDQFIPEASPFQEDENSNPLETEIEALVYSDLDTEEGVEPYSPLSDSLEPDTQRERDTIRGISALGRLRLPLDNVLSLITSKILWEAFYRRLFAWYGSLYAYQTVTAEDVEKTILSAYPEHRDNEFVIQTSAIFVQEVEEAVNLVAALPGYGWQGPQLRLDQANAARRMTEILRDRKDNQFLLVADEPGLGKSAEFLAAVAASGIQSVVLVAPKLVADDTWTGQTSKGEICRCLPPPYSVVVRGLPRTLEVLANSPPSQLTFFVLHYEELVNNDNAVETLKSYTFDCLCVDEIHRIKQRADQKKLAERKIELHKRREAIENIRASANTAIGLTGTPLVNELAEPLSLLQILSQHDPQFDYTRLSNGRMSDIADVFEAIIPHIVRRRKRDILLQLPKCDIRRVEIVLSPDIENRMIEICLQCQSDTLAKLHRLLIEPKLPYILRRAQESGKLLVLTYMREGISKVIFNYLENYLPKQTAHVDGDVSQATRRKLIESFREPNGVRVLVGTIRTIGEGLTLFDPAQQITACEMVIADLPYTWAEFEQSISRLHRTGQKQRVMVDVLQTTTAIMLRDGSPFLTLDRCIWDLITGKRRLSDLAIDGEFESTNSARKVRNALHYWLKQAREAGFEPLAVEHRQTEESDARKWRREISHLRGMAASKADEVFANLDYTHNYLEHLKVSSASKLSYRWLRKRLEPLLRPDLDVVDMGCGLHPLANLPCRVIGLDRHNLPGQLQGKMENPPLPNKSADVLVYSLSLYGTAYDHLAYFSQARRILRSGGHLLIVEPASAYTPKRLGRFIKGLREFGFEPVDKIKKIWNKDGSILIGLHLILTGERRKPDVTAFERR